MPTGQQFIIAFADRRPAVRHVGISVIQWLSQFGEANEPWRRGEAGDAPSVRQRKLQSVTT